MNGDKFTEQDAIVGIEDIRYLVSIMFGTTDLLTIKRILEKAGYPFGSPTTFSKQIRNIHKQWMENGNNIEKIKGYFGMVDPFNKLGLETNYNL
jgi:hypothetical protein